MKCYLKNTFVGFIVLSALFGAYYFLTGRSRIDEFLGILAVISFFIVASWAVGLIISNIFKNE